MRMQDVTIRTKILLSFAFMLLVTIAIGGVASQRLSAVNDQAVIIRENYLPSLGLLGHYIENYELFRVRQTQILVAPESERENWVKQTDSVIDIIAKLRGQFEPYIDAGEERARWVKLDALLEKYFAQYKDVLALVRKGDMEGAGKLSQGEMRESVRIGREILMEELDYNEKKGKAAANAGEEIFVQTRIVLLVSILLAVVLSLAAGVALVRGVSKPVMKMSGDMENLANGRIDIDVEGTDRGDEIGILARAMQVFKDNAIKARALETEKQQAQAAREARAKRIEELNANFDRMASGALDLLASASTELHSTASSMSSSAVNASQQAGAVAAASEEASANVQAVASATEELASSISEISRQVSQSSTIAAQAVQEAEQTNQTVAELAQTAQKIGEVVGLINEIASQTNLLALNATIEAARAGEAGKGFAVVASEVKGLATQTAKATEDISAQVSSMQTAMANAVSAIESIGRTIRSMNDISASVAAAVEEQGAATKEITRNVSEASQGTADVTRNIAGVNQTVEETGAAAGQVLSASEELSKQAEVLRSNVRGFLHDIQSA